MTKQQAKEEFTATYGSTREEWRNDKPGLREAWNDYTDRLCKDGQITQRQYDRWLNPFKWATREGTSSSKRKRYNVFHRTWWTENPKWPQGREPGAGERYYIEENVTYLQARKLCEEYNSTHEPGFLSDKAEFEEA